MNNLSFWTGAEEFKLSKRKQKKLKHKKTFLKSMGMAVLGGLCKSCFSNRQNLTKLIQK